LRISLQSWSNSHSNGIENYILVSSIGADANSSSFYLRTKGELEQKLSALGFAKLVCVRPSLILGNREEFRFGEKLGVVLDTILSPLMIGPLKKYRGVHVDKIVRMLIKASKESFPEKLPSSNPTRYMLYKAKRMLV
jgi:uncharacterized protein YbjT (DUF2867 family)